MNKLRLYWWNERKIQGKSKENYGDLLGKYLVERISGKQVVFRRPNKWHISNLWTPIYVTIGSILTHVNKKCVVWGSGIISLDIPVQSATFLAVRGPQTRKFLLSQGHQVPEVYGDPALLLPDYYNPKVDKKYNFGIIPHYNDFKTVKDWYGDVENVCLIDLMTNDIEETTKQILSCDAIVSSSLHGVIVAHAYGIPAVWQQFSDKVFGDGIKYQDYFESVNIEPYVPQIQTQPWTASELKSLFEKLPNLPEKQIIEHLKTGLLAVCPFKKERL